MRLIKNIGFVLFLAGVAMLLSTLFMGKYMITDEVIETSISNERHRNELMPVFNEMRKSVFDSKVDFIQTYNAGLEKVNDDFKSSENWDEVIWDDYSFSLLKNAAIGSIADRPLVFFYLCFILTIVGGLMFVIPEWILTTPGIKNDGIFFSKMKNRGWSGIAFGVALIVFYILLYQFPQYLVNWVVMLDPISERMSGHPSDQWFLYGFMYCAAMIVMGLRMYIKYRDNNYQKIRTVSVLFFQICFAFTLPQILKRLNMPAYDLKSAWPLEYSFFFDYRLDEHLAAGTFGIWMMVWGIVLFALGVPIFTYLYGKRWYCSWVCGCGGLAETLGDPFRQLSNKTLKAWKIERITVHSVLVYSVVMTAAVLYSYFFDDYDILGISVYDIRNQYGFFIGFAFAGVVGTGFYPLMGNRVWCRFGCPLAAYLGIIQRFKSRFRITTNGGQCISCGNCSTYCEMGIDVRWYAQRGQNIVRSSCVGCGVCSSVCPRGVLKLENGPETGRINDDPILIGSNSVKLNV